MQKIEVNAAGYVVIDGVTAGILADVLANYASQADICAAAQEAYDAWLAAHPPAPDPDQPQIEEQP